MSFGVKQFRVSCETWLYCRLYERLRYLTIIHCQDADSFSRALRHMMTVDVRSFAYLDEKAMLSKSSLFLSHIARHRFHQMHQSMVLDESCRNFSSFRNVFIGNTIVMWPDSINRPIKCSYFIFFKFGTCIDVIITWQCFVSKWKLKYTP